MAISSSISCQVFPKSNVLLSLHGQRVTEVWFFLEVLVPGSLHQESVSCPEFRPCFLVHSYIDLSSLFTLSKPLSFYLQKGMAISALPVKIRWGTKLLKTAFVCNWYSVNDGRLPHTFFVGAIFKSLTWELHVGSQTMLKSSSGPLLLFDLQIS